MPRFALLASTLLIVLISGSNPATQTSQAAPFELPAPTGSFAVGTTSWVLTDQSRRESFAGGNEYRQARVDAWYPTTARTGTPAPYLRETIAEARTFAKLIRGPEGIFDSLQTVRTHAVLDAPPVPAGRKLPVLLFGAGYTGPPTAYTALFEDLASHGYAVLDVVHPYEVTAARLAGGRVVTLLDDAGALLSPIRDVLGEWGKEDETMAAVTRASDPNEQLRLLREYLSGLRNTNVALKRWVDDTKLVVDRLSTLPPKSIAAHLASRLDAGRVGVFGHSMGGVVAGQFCVEDRRCRAGLNLDGIPQYGAMIDATTPAAFLMVYSARPGRLGSTDAIYRRAARRYYRVDVPDTRHLDLSDMTFWGGPLRERPMLGSIPPQRVTDITRAIVRGYFDQELLGRRAALAAALARYPEVVIKTDPTQRTLRTPR